MAEQYVESIMDFVERKAREKRISEASFWHWLGNVKYKEDGGNLSVERAAEIRQNITKIHMRGRPKDSR